MAAAGAKLALFVDYWYRRQLMVAMTTWLHMELVPLLKKKKKKKKKKTLLCDCYYYAIKFLRLGHETTLTSFNQPCLCLPLQFIFPGRIYHHGLQVEVKCSTTERLINKDSQEFIVDIQVMITLPLSL